MAFTIADLHDLDAQRSDLLALNNANARETSFLTLEKFGSMITAATVATVIPPAAAFALAFAPDDRYDGRNFLWFRSRFDSFLYIDRVVVYDHHRRQGLGRLLYADIFRRSASLGLPRIACEVNTQPPNPVSTSFHAAHGFHQVGTATFDDGAKTVSYLVKTLP